MKRGEESGCRREPDFFRSQPAQDSRALGSAHGNGLIVIALQEIEPHSGPDAARLEELQQLPIALIDAADQVMFSGLGLGEKLQTAPATAARTFALTEVAMRAGTAGSEFGEKPRLEVGRDGVLQALGFGVHLVPLHPEDF